MKKIILGLVCIALLLSFTADAKRKKAIEVIGGTPIPGVGLAIDASYDKRLDNFVPGYKVISVAIVNASFNIIGLNPQKDKWWIKLKSKKKKYPVIADLRREDPQAWHQIPVRARGLIGYPLALPIGARQVIDLFVSSELDVEEFSKLIIEIHSLGVTFNILPRE